MNNPISTASCRFGALVLCLVVLGIGGCGYQLRGSLPLPEGIKSIYILPAAGALFDEVAMELGAAGVEIATSRAAADAILSFGPEFYDRRTVSVDAVTSSAREFEIVYTVGYRVTNPAGAELVVPGSVKLRRDFVFETGAILGTNREAATLNDDLRRDAVREIVQRLYATFSG